MIAHCKAGEISDQSEIFNLQSPICNLQSAICNLQSAILTASSAVSWRRRMVQMNDLGSGRLLQDKFVVGQRLVHLELYHGKRYIVFLFGPPDFDAGGKQDCVVIFVIAVVSVGDQSAGFIVNQLPVGQQVNPAEDDLSRKPTVISVAANHVNYIIGLLELTALVISN